MKIVKKPIDGLRPHPKNYRQHSPHQISVLVDSLKAHGQPKPVVIQADGTILAGHGLVEAAKMAGWKTIECSIYEGKNPDAFVAMDNRSGDLATDDQQLLAELLQSFDEADLSAAGYDKEELANLMKSLAADEANGDFDPASEDEQGRLDKKKSITCPECGHAFVP